MEINDQEATKGVEHGKVALQLVTGVDSLEEASDLINIRHTFSKTKLEEFRSRFPA